MLDFFQYIYDFFSSNIIVVSVVTVLGVLATILEKSSKIKTPIQSAINKHKDKRKRESILFDNILNIKDDVQQLQGHYACILSNQDTLSKQVGSLQEKVLENESDRLKDILYQCGNNCRRHLPLTGEEFRHIQDVHYKYHDILGQNHDGESEYNFIVSYYNSDANQEVIQVKR